MSTAARTLLVAAAVGALSTAALGGCAKPGGDSAGAGADGGGQTSIGGSGPDDPTSNADSTRLPTTITAPPATGPALPAQLTITVDDGSGTVTTYTLRCEPAGGDHPDPVAACAALAAAGPGVFAPPDPDLACTEIYGGPQTATVTGQLDGARVDSTFSRTDGCQIARWDALAIVLGMSGGAY